MYSFITSFLNYKGLFKEYIERPFENDCVKVLLKFLKEKVMDPVIQDYRNMSIVVLLVYWSFSKLTVANSPKLIIFFSSF